MTIASTLVAFQPYHQSLSQTSCHFKSFSKCSSITQKLNTVISRRRVATTTTALATVLLGGRGKESILNPNSAYGFDFRLTVPDQTPEEAEFGIKNHAQDLLQVKVLLDSESWKEFQKVLRKSSSDLKQDIYTLIQAKPGDQRPQLRKLYSNLFNTVTKLDYAARSKEKASMEELYDNMVVALNDIFSRIYN